MNPVKVILGMAAAAVAVVGYTLSQTASKLQMGSVKLDKINLHLLYVEVYLTLPITNPTGKNVRFDGFDGGLVYGSHKLGSIKIAKNQVLKAKQTVNVSVVMEVRFLEVGLEVAAAIKNKDFINNLFIIGTIKSQLGKVRIKNKVF